MKIWDVPLVLKKDDVYDDERLFAALKDLEGAKVIDVGFVDNSKLEHKETEGGLAFDYIRNDRPKQRLVLGFNELGMWVIWQGQKGFNAFQWFKNGDHPQDNTMRPFEDTGIKPTEPREGQVVRYFRHPSVSGGSKCPHCENIMDNHGWIDCGKSGRTVCPGDYIITGEDGGFYPIHPDAYKKLF